MSKAKIDTLTEAKAAIVANGGKAPKSIWRCRIERAILAPDGRARGYKNQRGYEIGGVFYATVADILKA